MDCKKKEGCGCSLDAGRGCWFCNCGEEVHASVCEGCFKLHTTDWLEQLPQVIPTDIYEVRFKNTRRGYYRNVNGLDLRKGDIVAVEASPGHDIGIISLAGDMVARQMKRVGFTPLNGEFRKIYRKAKPYDIEKWQEAIALEHETMIRSRQIAADMGLNMKIGDVEYQGDKIKAIFYYIADERVDFRELIKVFADQFRIRVEMKQIGARQEAGRIGGLGSCGRELCCASWISSFVSVTTNAARTQEISLNPQKLAGQCSKLKCCMIYELDTYIDARKDIPRVNQPLRTLDGEYYLVKSDILAGTMSFSTSADAMVGMVTLPVKRVKEILEINKRGEKADTLEVKSNVAVKEDPGFVNVIGEDSITRFDKSASEKRKSRNGRKNKKPATGTHDKQQVRDKVQTRGEHDNSADSRRENRSRTQNRDGIDKAAETRKNDRENNHGRPRQDKSAEGAQQRGDNRRRQQNQGAPNRKEGAGRGDGPGRGQRERPASGDKENRKNDRQRKTQGENGDQK